jgi:uncharacterized damage-inducible protein DinB
MFRMIAGAFLACTLVLVAHPVVAQHDDPMYHEGMDHESMHPNLFADLDQDIAVVKNKLMGLADAIPEDAYDWRPAEGVRSVRETLLHVAADNYFIPTALGVEPPTEAGISDDYASTKAYEMQELSKDEVMKALEESFAHLRRILEESDPMSVGAEVSLFGRESTVQKTWILTATHLHEHLGQMIAYARTNDVAPPWSM